MWFRRIASFGLGLLAIMGSGLALLSHGHGSAVAPVPWTPRLDLSGTAGHSFFPQIAANPGNGDLWVAWAEVINLDPGQSAVLVRRRFGETGVWSEPLNLSGSSARNEGPVIYLEGGQLHLAWTRRIRPPIGANATDLLYRRWDGSGWSAEQVLDHAAVTRPSNYGLFFIRGGAGRLCLFVTEGSGVTHTCLQESGWEALAPWSYVEGMKAVADIVLGPDGRFHVAALGKNEYGDVGYCEEQLSDAYYTSTDGTTWDPLVNLSYHGSIAYDVALAYDAGGSLHFLWSDHHSYCSLDSEKSAIYERVRDGAGWGSRGEVIPYNPGQAVLDLVVRPDGAGRLHLAWSEGLFEGIAAAQLSVRYAVWQSGAWGEEEVVWGSLQDNLNVDLALYSGTVPAVVWEEGPPWTEEVSFSLRAWPANRCFLAFLEKRLP